MFAIVFSMIAINQSEKKSKKDRAFGIFSHYVRQTGSKANICTYNLQTGFLKHIKMISEELIHRFY